MTRPRKTPERVYDFEKRIESLQNEIEKCFDEIEKFGFPSRFTSFSIENLIEERHSIQIRFSRPIGRLFFNLSKRWKIKKVLAEMKYICPDNNNVKILTITPKKIFVIGEEGLSAFKYVINLACKIIKRQLKNKKRKLAEKILNRKKMIQAEAEKIFPNVKVKVFYKREDGYHVKVNAKKTSAEFINKSPRGLIEFIKDSLFQI